MRKILVMVGVQVIGYELKQPTQPSLLNLCHLDD